VLWYRSTGKYQLAAKAESDARIAEAGTKAASANERAAVANAQAAKANEGWQSPTKKLRG